MSGALAPGKQWAMVAGVSIITLRTIESPITRALSSGFSVGASLSGENLFNVLIGMEEWCFVPRLGRLTVPQLPCCTGSSETKQCTGFPEIVASKAISTALTFLLSSVKVWMHVSSSKMFSVSLTISLHLSHVNPSLLTEIDKLYMWQRVQTTIAGEEAITFTFTFTFMHLADAFIQSDLHCIQVTVSTFYQLLLSLGIEPMILALLAPCSTSWATGKLENSNYSLRLMNDSNLTYHYCLMNSWKTERERNETER